METQLKLAVEDFLVCYKVVELSKNSKSGSDSNKTKSDYDDQAINIADMVDSQVETYGGDDENVGFWEGMSRSKRIFFVILAVFVVVIAGLLVYSSIKSGGSGKAERQLRLAKHKGKKGRKFRKLKQKKEVFDGELWGNGPMWKKKKKRKGLRMHGQIRLLEVVDDGLVL